MGLGGPLALEALTNVVITSPSVGQALAYASATDDWRNTTIDLTTLVSLAPGSSARNVIQPTGDYVPLTLKGYSGQSLDLLELKNSSGVTLSQFDYAGRLAIGCTPDSNAQIKLRQNLNGVTLALDNQDSTANYAAFAVSTGTGSMFSGTSEYLQLYKDTNGWVWQSNKTGSGTVRAQRWSLGSQNVLTLASTGQSVTIETNGILGLVVNETTTQSVDLFKVVNRFGGVEFGVHCYNGGGAYATQIIGPTGPGNEAYLSWSAAGSYRLAICDHANVIRGKFWYGGADFYGNVSANAEAANVVAFTINGFASQTANLLDVKNSTGTKLAVIDSAGHIGIGTGSTAPAAPLEVKVNGTALIQISSNGGGAYLGGIQFVNDFSGLSSAIYSGNSDNSLQVWNHLNGPVLFGTNNTTRMRITPAGLLSLNAGVTPGAQFHVLSSTAATVGQIVQAAGSQTADLWQGQDSIGTVLSKINSAGRLRIGSYTTGLEAHAGIHVKAPLANTWGITAEASSNGAVLGVSHNGATALISTSYLDATGDTPITFVTAAANRLVIGTDGNIAIVTAGAGLKVAEGSNAKMGVATLVAGTVTVNTTAVTANSRIFITVQSLGTVAVASGYAVTARTAGMSFTLTASSITDTSILAWFIVEPA